MPTVECAETSYELPCQQWADEAEIAPVGGLSLANATGRKNRSMHRGADESRRLQGPAAVNPAFNNQQVMPFGGGCDDVALRFGDPRALVTI